MNLTRRRTAQQELYHRLRNLAWVKERPAQLQDEIDSLTATREERAAARAELADQEAHLANLAAAEKAVAEVREYLAEHGDTWWD